MSELKRVADRRRRQAELGKGEGKGTRRIGVHDELGCCLDCSAYALGLPVALDLNPWYNPKGIM